VLKSVKDQHCGDSDDTESCECIHTRRSVAFGLTLSRSVRSSGWSHVNIRALHPRAAAVQELEASKNDLQFLP
jgi:hypothetical protein